LTIPPRQEPDTFSENDEEEVRQDAEKIIIYIMNNLKSLLCSLVISEKGFCFIVFIVALQVVYFFVDVNLTQSFSQKTGMARHAI
jgi:hypothetical protein